jgi:hypothetical protein
MPDVSILVATRNRRESLAGFLSVVSSLSDSPSWELIVVDNGSTDGTDDLLLSAAARVPIISIYEGRPGKSRALNRALARARGEILVFTDDDVIPGPQWLVALYSASQEYPDANVFGGKVVVNYDTLPGWIAKSYNLKTILASEHDLGSEMSWFGLGQYPVGPNIAVRKSALHGGQLRWPVNLGPGTKIPVGDERAFLIQVSPPQVRDRLYVPGSIVRHNPVCTKIGLGSAMRRCFLGGYAAGLIVGNIGHSAVNRGTSIHHLAWHRLRSSSSTPELMCIVARAAGVMLGVASPFPRIVYN